MKKRYIFLGILILLCAAAFIYFSRPAKISLTESQKQAQVSKILGRKAILTDSTGGYKIYKDTYVSFKFPAEATVYNYKDPGFASSSGLIGSYSYDLSHPKVVFNYAAYKRVSVLSLNDDPSFRLRTMPERSYRQSAINMAGVAGVLFSKDDSENSERSIFVFRKGVVYSFVITGSDPSRLDASIKLTAGSFSFNN